MDIARSLIWAILSLNGLGILTLEYRRSGHLRFDQILAVVFCSLLFWSLLSV